MSDLYELFDLIDMDLIDASIGESAKSLNEEALSNTISKAFEAPEDDFPEPPITDNEFPEPPVMADDVETDTEEDDYDATLDAANQEIEEAGNAAVADDFPEPPDGEDEEVIADNTDELPEEEVAEEPVDETATDTPEDVEVEYKKKLRIHSNMKRLLSIVKNSRDSFEQKFSSKISGNLYKDYHMILNTFDDLYNTTENILINEFNTSDSKKLVKHCVSLVKVYDILHKMTENFMDAYIKENSETNS